MAAIALVEARARDRQAAIAARIDAVGAGEVAVAAPQMAEGRPVDADRVARRVARQNAFLAVAEQAVGDGQVAAFQPDARTIAIGPAQILEDEAVYGDRKRVVSGKSVSVRVDIGGRRILKKK